MDSNISPRSRILIKTKLVNPTSKEVIRLIRSVKRLRQRQIDRRALAGDDTQQPEFEESLQRIDAELEELQKDLLNVLKREIDRIPIDVGDAVGPSVGSMSNASQENSQIIFGSLE